MKPDSDELLGKLTFSSPISELMRVLFFYSLQYVVLEKKKKYHIFRQEDIVAFLHKSEKDTSISKLFLFAEKGANTRTNLPSRMKNSERMLCITAEKETYITTFEEVKYRCGEDEDFPLWWNIPLPLLTMKDHKVILNAKAQESFSLEDFSLKRVFDALQREDRLLEINADENEKRVFYFEPLLADIYLIDEVTSDLSAAEDMVWWAAVGKAWAQKMRRDGYEIHQVDGIQPSPIDLLGADDYLTCVWDEKILGYLCFKKMKEASK